MPSVGKTLRQVCPSSRELDPLDRRVIVLHVERDDRPPALELRRSHDDSRRRVVDLEGLAVHLAGQRGRRRVRRRIRCDNADEVRPVRDGRRVPHDDRFGDTLTERLPPRFALAAVQHVVHEVVVVVVVRLPHQRLEPLLVGAAADRRGAHGALRRVLGSRDEFAIGRGLVVESGDLRLPGRVRLLEHDAGRLDGDRMHLRPQVALHVRGRHRCQHAVRPLLPLSTTRHCR